MTYQENNQSACGTLERTGERFRDARLIIQLPYFKRDDEGLAIFEAKKGAREANLLAARFDVFLNVDNIEHKSRHPLGYREYFYPGSLDDSECAYIYADAKSFPESKRKSVIESLLKVGKVVAAVFDYNAYRVDEDEAIQR